MTDRNKFEEMLERLVNEDRAGAEELFHELVVEKSRDIYESLLAEEEDDIEETTDEEVDEATDEDLDESDDEDLDESEDEDLDESDDEDLDEAEDEEVEEGFFGEADPTDDMMGDIAMPGDEGDMDMGMDMGDDDMGMGDEEGDLADEVADLKDELEALKAEFEAMLGNDSDDDMGDMPMDIDSEEGDEEDEEDDDDDDDDDDNGMPFKSESKTAKTSAEMMREYADKVAPAKMGDNGANAKSIVAGKNDMGGTTANIAKGGESKTAGTQGGLAAPTPKDMNTKNVNVPGAKAATKMTAQPGHGAEKKGKPENADKGAGSPLNGAPKRAK